MPDATDLSQADLHVDEVYRGGRRGNAADDPLPLLLGVSNMGGFRYRGSLDDLKVVVLTTSLADKDWPDALDQETGVFTYYGDNKKPGRALHDTPRFGNEILRRLYDNAHGGAEARLRQPPVLVFASAGDWRDVIFHGLAVPGTDDLRLSEDLVAIWRTSGGRRFQNYRARFTILDAPVVCRSWLQSVFDGQSDLRLAPKAWRRWVESGDASPLLATPTATYRKKAAQLPADQASTAIIELIHDWFQGRPHDFEACAGAITRMLLPDVTSLDLTRPSRDGGRDATGRLRIGHQAASILVDFAMEAKCYNLGSSVGVREVSRLISRLRHRQFGVLVTTSYLDSQAYQEIREDEHPIIVISAVDIVNVLRLNGRSDLASVSEWLSHAFPRPPMNAVGTLPQ